MPFSDGKMSGQMWEENFGQHFVGSICVFFPAHVVKKILVNSHKHRKKGGMTPRFPDKRVSTLAQKIEATKHFVHPCLVKAE